MEFHGKPFIEKPPRVNLNNTAHSLTELEKHVNFGTNFPRFSKLVINVKIPKALKYGRDEIHRLLQIQLTSMNNDFDRYITQHFHIYGIRDIEGNAIDIEKLEHNESNTVHIEDTNL